MHIGLSFRQIETFYWVARCESFSEAALHLNTTQPAISHRIRELEALLGVQLFNRGGRRITLTPEALDLFDIAERMIRLGDSFLGRARATSGVRGMIRIGAADTIALTWLPRLVAGLSQHYPKVDVELFVDLSVNIQAKLLEGDLDIGFLVGGAPDPTFTDVPLGLVRNAWMCSPALRLPEARLGPADLATWPILTHSRGSHQWRTLQQWFSRAGVRTQRVHGCSSLATMIEMTAGGLGIAMLPPQMIRRHGRSDRFRLLDVAPELPPTPFSCVYSERTLGSVIATTVSLARALVAEDPCFESAGLAVEGLNRIGSAGRSNA